MGVDPTLRQAAGALAPVAPGVAKYQELHERLVGGEGEMEYIVTNSPAENP
jgi:hypothetical protein